MPHVPPAAHHTRRAPPAPPGRLVCTRCGETATFEPAALDLAGKSVAERVGFEVASRTLALYGRCSACRAAGPGAGASRERA